MNTQYLLNGVIVVVLLVILGGSPFYSVDLKETAIVVQLGTYAQYLYYDGMTGVAHNTVGQTRDP